MQFLYQLSQVGYSTLIHLVAPFNEKAKLLKKGRKKVLDKLSLTFKDNKNPVAWFHAASLGEFEQARPVIEKFKIDFPNYKILLTFFSPSGYEVRKDYQEADFIFYLPQDGKSTAQQFISIVKPNIAFFAKYEFWHFYIQKCKQQNIPLISFSTIFREGQIYFKNKDSFYQNILKNVSQRKNYACKIRG